VDEALDLIPNVPVVLDPVMVAESGARLLDQDAIAALAERLVPRATVVTPNLPEARVLAGEAAPDEPHELARAVLALGPRAVVVTGGHRSEAVDLYLDADGAFPIPGERRPDGAAHGSGCTHSSALAAYIALGLEPLAAARRAKEVAAAAVADGLREIGSGAGPVDVFGLARRRGADSPGREGPIPSVPGRLT
jgi:hydroxymethylpyrimidine/phosphomethylpyrimidine kinase